MTDLNPPAMVVPRLTPIIPVNAGEMDAAITFFTNLKFASPPVPSYPDYIILTHPSGIDVHLQPAVPGWLVPGQNPFGVYLYVTKEEVDRLAVVFEREIIGKVKSAKVQEWGMYEFALNGPSGCLVRVGCKAGH